MVFVVVAIIEYRWEDFILDRDWNGYIIKLSMKGESYVTGNEQV
jgi:hypothetical protein